MPESEVTVVSAVKNMNVIVSLCPTLKSRVYVSGQALFGATADATSEKSIAVAALVIEIVCALALVAALILVKTRLWRTLFACGLEICAWRICKTVLGADSLVSTIMTWLTAGVLIVLTLVIVNNIHWKHPNVRSDQPKPTEPARTDDTNDPT